MSHEGENQLSYVYYSRFYYISSMARSHVTTDISTNIFFTISTHSGIDNVIEDNTWDGSELWLVEFISKGTTIGPRRVKTQRWVIVRDPNLSSRWKGSSKMKLTMKNSQYP